MRRRSVERIALPQLEDTYRSSTVRRPPIRSLPLGRIATPDEDAEFIAFFASDAASMVTGQLSVIKADRVVIHIDVGNKAQSYLDTEYTISLESCLGFYPYVDADSICVRRLFLRDAGYLGTIPNSQRALSQRGELHVIPASGSTTLTSSRDEEDRAGGRCRSSPICEKTRKLNRGFVS